MKASLERAQTEKTDVTETGAAGESGGRRLLAYAMLGLVMLLWSGNMIVGRAVRTEIPPFTLAFVRWAGALCVILPFTLRHVIADRTILRREWKPVLLLGLTGVAAFNAFLYSGLRYTTATNALLLQAAIPALVLIFDRLVFGVRSAAAQVLGVSLSTVGVLVIVARGDLRSLLQLHLGFGDVLVLCGVLAWSAYTSLLKIRPACHPLSFLTVTFAIGVLAMAPLAATEWRSVAAISWGPGVIGAFAYVALLPSVVAYTLYNAAVAEVGAGPAGQTISLMPLFGAGLAALLLGELLHRFHIAGMALIVVGIAVAAIGGRLRPR